MKQFIISSVSQKDLNNVSKSKKEYKFFISYNEKIRLYINHNVICLDYIIEQYNLSLYMAKKKIKEYNGNNINNENNVIFFKTNQDAQIFLDGFIMPYEIALKLNNN